MESNEKNYPKIIKLFLILIFLLALKISIKNNDRKLLRNHKDYLENNCLIEFKKHFLLEYLNNSEFFKIIHVQYSFSFKFKKMKVEYNFGFYDKNNNIILPSDLALYNNLHVFCNIQIKNNSIDSLSNIYKNKFYNCIEFCEINENIKFGIKIKYNKQFSKIHYFTEKIFTYNNIIYQFDDIFDPLFINNQYNSLTFLNIIQK